MNNFLVFSGATYYPGGGWSDFEQAFPTLELAQAYCAALKHDWWEIVDLSKMDTVEDGGIDHAHS